MNKHTKKILTGSFFVSLLLWGSIFFFFPQEMTNDGLKKILKENDNVYYLANVKEKELPVATFSSQKRTNSSNFRNNSVTPMVSYTPLHVKVNVNNSVAAGMENYSSGALYSQNIISPDPVSNGGGNLGIGLMAGLSSGRQSNSNSNRSEGSGLSSSVNLVEPFSNNTPSTLHRQLVNDDTPNSGGTDPGGDPVGPPIPVGDGIGFLILLASGYGGIKMKLPFFKKTKLER
ncbi:MAG TPA: hypothetical protein P5312_11880 [Bacteroidales bacterium]|nr:hypothetical protein [Bacteroidales bacterium]HRT79222.1 hypothetical protein [Paludibacteraceae bacterium]